MKYAFHYAVASHLATPPRTLVHTTSHSTLNGRIYTVSRKKQDTKLLPITLPNINRCETLTSRVFRVWWGIYISLCYKFPTESNSERILKIG